MDPIDISELFPLTPNGELHAKEYLENEGLLKYLDDIAIKQDRRIKPKYCDLGRLHLIARKRKVQKALEFGVGFSSIVISDAILKNEKEYDLRCETDAKIRDKGFSLYSVDSYKEWIEKTEQIIPKYTREIVTFHESGVSVTQILGRICHTYDSLPNVVPDFIYIDGPDPASVKGDINGQDWSIEDRPVMSADLIQIEPTLMPGCLVLIDGRSLNARFLIKHLYRNWKSISNLKNDITVLELQEKPLGLRNKIKLDYQLGSHHQYWKNPINE